MKERPTPESLDFSMLLMCYRKPITAQTANPAVKLDAEFETVMMTVSLIIGFLIGL